MSGFDRDDINRLDSSVLIDINGIDNEVPIDIQGLTFLGPVVNGQGLGSTLNIFSYNLKDLVNQH